MRAAEFRLGCSSLVDSLRVACLRRQGGVQTAANWRGVISCPTGYHCRISGQEIGRRVCDAAFFQESTTVAVYLTAPRLREVDTSQLVKTLLEAGETRT